MKVRGSTLFFLILTIFLSVCGSIAPPASVGAGPNSPNPELEDINGVTNLKTILNQDQGQVRLVLLISPT
jgi:hypothetical protein